MGEASQVTQYIAAIAATMGGFALGNVIGWFSPAEPLIKKKLPKVTSDQQSWISSIMTLGAATSAIYMGIFSDIIGRKWVMITIAPPFVVGWLCLAMSNSVGLLCLGRFITGFCGGCFCVAAPTFTAELAQKEIRGMLGVFFQLLLVIGIIFTFAFGELNSITALTIPCAVIPIIVFVMMLFLPESPVLLLKKGKTDAARSALQFYRGKDYNIDGEISQIQAYTTGSNESFMVVLKKKSTLKAIVMLGCLHIIQQLSGINAVMFYAQKIFTDAGSEIAPGLCSIILGIVQVIATGVSAYAVDRAGRKMLWMISLSAMGVTCGLLGYFFMIYKNDESAAKRIAWLPLVSLCVYVVGFSLGAGPLPWAQIGELLPDRVKSVIGSAASFVNWMLAFAVTKSFPVATETLGAHFVFWFYGIICALGFVFVFFILIETKNKTLDEIQQELGAE